MTGRTYLLRGQPVTVVTAYNGRRRDLPDCPAWLHWIAPPKGAPQNVAITVTVDGQTRTVVRPFRGLRRPT